MKTRHKIFIIFLFSLCTHILGIWNPILDYHGWAQTLRASIARNYYEEGMNFFNPQVDYQGHNPKYASTQFPLYSYGVALLYKIFGFWEGWGRLLSAFFAALSAVVLFAIAREFLEERVAFLSALFFCVIPLRIYFMRTIMPESMAIFFMLLSYWYVLRWDRDKQFFPNGVFCSLTFTLSALLKIPYLFMASPILYLLMRSHPFNLKRVLLFLAVLIIGVGAWYTYATLGTMGLSAENQPFLYETNIPWEWFHWEFWSTQFLSRYPELLTTYSGLIFLGIGLWISFKRQFSIIKIWFFSALLYLFICGRYGQIHQYALLPLTPIHAILMGIGFFSLWDLAKKRTFQIFLLLLAFAVPVHAALRIKQWYQCREEWVVEAKNVVDKISLDSDLFYIDAPDYPFFLYHLHRKGFTRPLCPRGTPAFKAALAQGLKFYFRPGARNRGLEDPPFLNQFKLLREDQNFVIYERIRKNHG